jgi:hypothetical protein
MRHISGYFFVNYKVSPKIDIMSDDVTLPHSFKHNNEPLSSVAFSQQTISTHNNKKRVSLFYLFTLIWFNGKNGG